jgi:tellurite resistance protein TehA-like permease
VSGRLGQMVEGLTPGYFALVMASGIISLGLNLGGFRALSWGLFGVCAAGFVILVILNGWRLARYRHAMAADFSEPRRAFGFFTFVAGTNVLGVRAAAEGWFDLAGVLLVVSGLTWLVLGYVVPWSAVLGREERPVVAAANGTWFIWVVASQSVAIASATLEPVVDVGRSWLALLAVLSWSVAVFLYAASAIFVSLRLMLYRLRPEDLDPPYWVSMGAVAITVVAGARIVEMESTPMVDATRGLIAGLSVVFWSFATWLIPVLVAAGGGRCATRRRCGASSSRSACTPWPGSTSGERTVSPSSKRSAPPGSGSPSPPGQWSSSPCCSTSGGPCARGDVENAAPVPSLG